MSNYSDKSDVDGNISSTNSTFYNHNASLITEQQQQQQQQLLQQPAVPQYRLNRSRSRSPISKSRSRSTDRSLSRDNHIQDSYHRRREHSPRYQHKKRERSLSSQRYRRRPSSRKRSRTPSHLSYQRYNPSRRLTSRHSPTEYARFNAHQSDLIDRFNPPENEILAIFGLSKRVNEQDLLDLYKHYGCKECKIIIDKHTGCPKGYGFVYFGRVKDAILAKKETDGKMLLNKPMRVDFSIGERDFTHSSSSQVGSGSTQVQVTPSSAHYSSQTAPYSKSNSYIDNNNRSSRYFTQQSDYYRRDQRAPLPSRELMPTRPDTHYRDRTPPLPSSRHHMNRYGSPPLSPHRAQSAIQRFNQQNGYYNNNKSDRSRALSPPPPPPQQNRNMYRRSSPPPRSRSRSIDRQRRYDHSLDYMHRNGTSNAMPRYNDTMITQHHRRSSRIV